MATVNVKGDCVDEAARTLPVECCDVVRQCKHDIADLDSSYAPLLSLYLSGCELGEDDLMEEDGIFKVVDTTQLCSETCQSIAALSEATSLDTDLEPLTSKCKDTHAADELEDLQTTVSIVELLEDTRKACHATTSTVTTTTVATITTTTTTVTTITTVTTTTVVTTTTMVVTTKRITTTETMIAPTMPPTTLPTFPFGRGTIIIVDFMSLDTESSWNNMQNYLRTTMKLLSTSFANTLGFFWPRPGTESRWNMWDRVLLARSIINRRRLEEDMRNAKEQWRREALPGHDLSSIDINIQIYRAGHIRTIDSMQVVAGCARSWDCWKTGRCLPKFLRVPVHTLLVKSGCTAGNYRKARSVLEKMARQSGGVFGEL